MGYKAMSKTFTSWTLGGDHGSPLTLANRLVVAPMCQYSALDGKANDWHLTHWTNMLNSGAGLFIIEATAVTRDGRISPGCLGLWDDATAAALAEHLHRARAQAPAMPVCIQLSHAGRKGSSAAPWLGGAQLDATEGGWSTLAPSAIAHAQGEEAPTEMTLADIQATIDAFANAADRAAQMGIDAIELHAAHGYLMHQFLSPISNHRTDSYGGDFQGRTRFVREVMARVRAVFPGPVGFRVSATDWVDGGWTPEDTMALAQAMKDAGADYAHISTAGVSPMQKIPAGPGFQLPFAQQVKQATGMTTIGVGLITEAQQVEAALEAEQCDLVAVARALLFNPRWPWEVAAQLGGQVAASSPYLRSLPARAKEIFGNVRIGMR